MQYPISPRKRAGWLTTVCAIGITTFACSSSSDDAPAPADAGADVVDGAVIDVMTSTADAAVPDPVRPWPDAPCPTVDIGFTAEAPPALLSKTGLYSNTKAKTLSAGVRAYAPAYTLWSDGAVKSRFAMFPKDCKIDTSDMDHWNMPVGTKFWKEFVVGGKRIETRLVARTGPKRDDYVLVSYAWRADASDADLAPKGALGALGTSHDIPPADQCLSCHIHLPEHVLGFGAIELAKGTGLNLSTLVTEGSLSAPPTTPVVVPGDATVSAALGYLHANCSNCHNPQGIPFQERFSMRLSVNDAKPEDTDVYKTAIGKPIDRFCGNNVTERIHPGTASASCLVVRPSTRSNDMVGQMQMPPIGSKVVDPTGLATIQAWIESLPH